MTNADSSNLKQRNKNKGFTKNRGKLFTLVHDPVKYCCLTNSILCAGMECLNVTVKSSGIRFEKPVNIMLNKILHNNGFVAIGLKYIDENNIVEKTIYLYRLSNKDSTTLISLVSRRGPGICFRTP